MVTLNVYVQRIKKTLGSNVFNCWRWLL